MHWGTLRIGSGVASVAIALVAPACAHQEQIVSRRSAVTFAGGDGATCDNAVIVIAKDPVAHAEGESDWLDHRYPGHRVLAQGRVDCSGGTADQATIRTRKGRRGRVPIVLMGLTYPRVYYVRDDVQVSVAPSVGGGALRVGF